MSQDVKIFDLESWEFKNMQIKAFSIQGHGPMMLKVSNRRFWDVKTCHSKLLTSLGSAPDAKIFDFDVYGFPNLRIEAVNILGPCPWMLKGSI